MKKTLLILSAVAMLASVFTGCKPENVPETLSGTKVSFNDAVAAVVDFYNTWDAERTIPAEVTVGSSTLSISEFLYMEATLIGNIKDGNTSDINVLSYVAASNPDRDSYDSDEIAVVNGPADGKGVNEDIANIAARILEAAAAKNPKQMPNQTIVYRGSDALAFCTNRAVVTIARAIAEYSKSGELKGKVSTEYLSAGVTLKAFAQQFVEYLDVWENTVAESLSSDGSHCEDNNNAWEKVHFIPIPQDTPNGWKKQGGQWDPKYQPYKTVTIDGTTYTAAHCWEIAIRGLLDMCTAEGSDFLESMTDRNKPYTLANGKSITAAPIRKPAENCIWGAYPWYENASDGGTVKYNDKPIEKVDLNFILKCTTWHVVRGLYAVGNNSPLGYIGNYQQFGTASSLLNLEGYSGQIAPMREFLILARFYKYILDNDINANVYDAIKDVKVDFDMYKQEALPVEIKTSKLEFEAAGSESQNAEFSAGGEWTATASQAWIHISPASGSAGKITATVAVDDNGDTVSREGTITIAVGDYSKSITVKQAARMVVTDATIKDFATEFVKVLDVWSKTTGTINQLTGEAAGEAQYDIENAHYIPDATTITVGGKTYSTADMFETALRSYLLLRGWDGNWTGGYGEANYGDAQKLAGSTMSATVVPVTHGYLWGDNPYNETGTTSAGNVTTANGGPVKMGDPKTADGVDLVKCDILDNFAFRSVNWPITKGSISNMCGYGNNRLPGYYGCFCAKRALITYAIFFKYMLDNNLETAVEIPTSTTFKTDLYGLDEKALVIRDFAKEYVKILDVWQNTTGKINMLTGEAAGEAQYDIENAHYVPAATTITVGEKTYNTADMLETALRSYLLLRGWDGNWTGGYGEASYGDAQKLAGSTMSATAIPETHNYVWGDNPYNETGTTSAGNVTTANGGPVRMGNPQTADGVEKVKCDILDNFAFRSTNWPVTKGSISNMCGYGNNRLPGYYGCFCAKRALLSYAIVFKYMLDNNIESATEIDAATTFDTIMF